MARSVAAVLESVRDSIASVSAARVAVGTPTDSESGLWLFPYRFAESAFARSSPTRGSAGAGDRSYVLHGLLIANPADNLAALDEGLDWMAERPLLTSEVARIRITPSELTTEEVTQIFHSAGLSLRLAIPLELTWTAN